MKNSPILLAFALTASSAFGVELEFTGKVVEATFQELIGRPCSIHLERKKPEGDQKYVFAAFPRVDGLTYSRGSREKPPVKVLYLTDLNDGDLFAKPGDLVGMGSKQTSGEMTDLSQRIYVEVDPSRRITGWRYLDQWYGNEIICH